MNYWRNYDKDDDDDDDEEEEKEDYASRFTRGDGHVPSTC